MQTLLLIAFVLLINCCVKKETNEKPITVISSTVTHLIKRSQSPDHFYKDESFLKAVYMAGSIENEIFKIIAYSEKTKQKQYLQINTLSYALRYIVNPKAVPSKVTLHCKIYQLKAIDNNKIEIYKACAQPAKLIATVHRKDSVNYDIEFNQAEWSETIGLVAHIVRKPRLCHLVLSNSKELKSLDCLETVYADDRPGGLEEIRFEKFIFQSDTGLRVHVVGGKYKDMSKRSSIDIKIPVSGKIQVNEHELPFKDDFQELIDEVTEK